MSFQNYIFNNRFIEEKKKTKNIAFNLKQTAILAIL